MKAVIILFLALTSTALLSAENPYLLFRDIDKDLFKMSLSSSKSLSADQRLENAYETFQKIKALQDRLRVFSNDLNLDVIDRINRDAGHPQVQALMADLNKQRQANRMLHASRQRALSPFGKFISKRDDIRMTKMMFGAWRQQAQNLKVIQIIEKLNFL